MLKNFFVNNFAIIDELNIEFSNGLNIITGETGAGKSIILEAISLLLGSRANSDFIRTGKDEAYICGEFILKDKLKEKYGENIKIERLIKKNGKNKIILNGNVITQLELKEISDEIVNIHEQDDNYEINNIDNHLLYLDSYAMINNLREEFSNYFNKKNLLLDELKKLEKEKEKYNKDYELYTYQKEEIEKYKDDLNQYNEYESELKFFENIEKLKILTNNGLNIFNNDEINLMNLVKLLRKNILDISKFDKDFENNISLMENIEESLNEIEKSYNSLDNKLYFDEERYQFLSAKVNELNKIIKKYGGRLDNIDEKYKEIEAFFNNFFDYDSKIKNIKCEIAEISDKLYELSERLHIIRKDYAKEFSNIIKEGIRDLGINNGNIDIRVKLNEEYNIYGRDTVEIYFQSNLGEDYKPLTIIGSGGEKSRIVFIIKSILASKIMIPTLIFDEIDTGVSGRIANFIGKKLEEIAVNRQVICVTHLPQIASKGKNHYSIYKEEINNRTITKVKKLTPEERIIEIAKLIGGEKITDTSVNHAKELLKI